MYLLHKIGLFAVSSNYNLTYMLKIIYKSILLILLLATGTAHAQETLQQQPGQRPKIGLALSGGGAKGLAHIGLLMAIDSAGIKVDYVTGTSMGSVAGGLYAAGYSGDSIMKLARKLDWITLLSNDPPLNSFRLREREDLGKYIELPLDRGKLALKRGFIESNELWMALSELFYPYYEITDFNDFDKSFRCIATDVATGEMVVLSKGNVVNAIRASMAIPSVFTPVEIDGKVLIDGGLARNFPVADAKQMGADIVIGSDVSGKLESIEEVNSPLDIISRLPFYNASSDLKEQRKLTDIYVDYPLDGYGTSSFASAADIIMIGMEKGRQLYPVLKRLKDSLDIIYGKQEFETRQLPPEPVLLSGVEIRGLKDNEVPLLMELLKLPTGNRYTVDDITAAIRRAFATRLFRKLKYSLQPTGNRSAKIIYDVEKRPTTFAQFGFHYNTTTGIAIKTGLVKKGFLNPFSSASLMFSIGENPRGEATMAYYMSKSRKFLIQARVNFEIIDITTYSADFSEAGLYNQASQNCDLQLLWQPEHNWSAGIGTTVSNIYYDPKITSRAQLEGGAIYLNTYLLLQYNDLNKPLYPTQGSRVFFKGGVVYNQVADFNLYYDDQVIATEDSEVFSFRPYTQIRLNYEQYFPAWDNAFLVQLQTGMNFNYKQAMINDFVVGGLNNVIRNQVTFAGLPEASIYTSSVVSVQAGYQHELFSNLFLTGKVNMLWYDFIHNNFVLNNTTRHGLGSSLTLGYRTFLGPIEASLMYSDMNHQVLPYFNIGYILII